MPGVRMASRVAPRGGRSDVCREDVREAQGGEARCAPCLDLPRFGTFVTKYDEVPALEQSPSKPRKPPLYEVRTPLPSPPREGRELGREGRDLGVLFCVDVVDEPLNTDRAELFNVGVLLLHPGAAVFTLVPVGLEPNEGFLLAHQTRVDSLWA